MDSFEVELNEVELNEVELNSFRNACLRDTSFGNRRFCFAM